MTEHTPHYGLSLVNGGVLFGVTSDDDLRESLVLLSGIAARTRRARRDVLPRGRSESKPDPERKTTQQPVIDR